MEAVIALALLVAAIVAGRIALIDFQREFAPALAAEYSILETYSYCGHTAVGFQAGAVSLVLTIFALVWITAGIWQRSGLLRYTGLAVLARVVVKIFWFDLRELDAFYRIIAFIVLGVLVLCGALLYLRFRDTFTRTVKPQPEGR